MTPERQKAFLYNAVLNNDAVFTEGEQLGDPTESRSACVGTEFDRYETASQYYAAFGGNSLLTQTAN